MIQAMTVHFAAIQKSNIDAALTAANIVFAAAERTAALQLATARSTADETMDTAKTLLAVKDLHELAQLQSTGMNGLDKTLAWARGMHEIATEAQQELKRIADAQIAEFNKTVVEMLDTTAANGPAADFAVAAVKSAMAAANTAYDTMSKTARRAGELAEANVASIRAIGSAPAAKARKAA